MSDGFTPLQLALLHVLWDRGESTVNDVTDALREPRDLAPTTVATLLARLEKRGHVARRKEGRLFLYRATIARQDAQRQLVDDLAEHLFEGDPIGLVQHLLSRKDVGDGDLAQVKRMIEEREGKGGTA